MAKKKFSMGMGSDEEVRNNVTLDTLSNNDVDTGYNFKYIPFEKIKPNKLNNDFPQDEIERLKLSIELNGLLHNIVVVYEIETDMYRLISGERRYHALDAMGEKERNKKFPKGIPAKIDKPSKDDVDEEIKVKEANLETRDYTPEQKVTLIRSLLKLYQIKQERGDNVNAVKMIMERYQLTERMVRKYVAANKMIPELQKILDKGMINISESEKFAAFSDEAQMQIYEMIMNNGKIDKSEIEALKKMEEEKKVLEKEVSKTTKELEEQSKVIEMLKKQLEEKELEEVAPEDVDTKEDKEQEIERLHKIIDKLSTENKKKQTTLEKLQMEAKEKAERNLNLSKDELKKAADFAKAENIHASMFNQVKELEKLQNVIKNDSELKAQYKVITTRIDMIFN